MSKGQLATKDRKEFLDPLGGEVPPLYTLTSVLDQHELTVILHPTGQRGKDVSREFLLVPGDRGLTGKPGLPGKQGPSGPVGRAGGPGRSNVPSEVF